MSNRGEVAPDSVSALRMAAMVERHPGQTSAKLAELIGWSAMHTGKALTGARKGGLIDVTKIGGTVRWFSAADMPAVLEQARREQREQQLATQKLSNLRHKERRAEKAADAQGSPQLSDQPIRRRADVRAPLPFKCRAPASVFHLGSTP